MGGATNLAGPIIPQRRLKREQSHVTATEKGMKDLLHLQCLVMRRDVTKERDYMFPGVWKIREWNVTAKG